MFGTKRHVYRFSFDPADLTTFDLVRDISDDRRGVLSETFYVQHRVGAQAALRLNLRDIAGLECLRYQCSVETAALLRH